MGFNMQEESFLLTAPEHICTVSALGSFHNVSSPLSDWLLGLGATLHTSLGIGVSNVFSSEKVEALQDTILDCEEL